MAEKIPIFNDPVQLQVREHVLKLEKNEINQSKKHIQHLNSDINTIRRQIEIIEDQSLRQNNGLFLLKLSITYLSLILIPILLAMKNIIAWTFLKIYWIGLSVLVGIIVYFNLRSVWKRNYNRFSLRNFDADIEGGASGKGTKTVRQLLEEKCPLSISETRNGTIFINPTNSAVRDDYLFSGCNSSNSCNTERVDPISKNILDNIPKNCHCGCWDLGDYLWDNTNRRWNKKQVIEKFTNQTDIQNNFVELQTQNMTDNDKKPEHFKPVESSLAFRNRL